MAIFGMEMARAGKNRYPRQPQKLREKDVFDYAQVRYAQLETDGELTVMPYPEHRPVTCEDAGVPVAAESLYTHLISDGVVLWENLKQAGVDRTWLKQELKKQGLRPRQVFLLAVDREGRLRVVRKEKR